MSEEKANSFMNFMEKEYGVKFVDVTPKPNATAFIEDVLLPELEKYQTKDNEIRAAAMAFHISQFIQSRRSEWSDK